MLTWIKNRSTFGKNVLVLMTGTSIAQAIPIAISPILTRLYSPDEFGLFALYMSIVTLLAVVATGRYEMAVILPRKDTDGANIVILSLLISLFVSILALVIIFSFKEHLIRWIGDDRIAKWLYFAPLSILLTGCYQSFNYWSNRRRHYRRLATSRVIQSGATSFNNLSLGVLGLGSGGLVIGQLAGQGLATFFLGKQIYSEDKRLFAKVTKLKIIALAKRYRKFPLFDIPSALAVNFNLHFSRILFFTIFASVVSGYYYLVQRVLNLPLAIIGNAIADVFREEAARSFKERKNARKIFMSTFKKLAFVSLLLSPLYFVIEDLFIIVFGADWAISGSFAKILFPMLLIRFVANPLSYMFYVAEKQGLNLIYQLILVVAIALSFYIGHSRDSYYIVVYSISGCYSVFYLFYIYKSYRFSLGS